MSRFISAFASSLEAMLSYREALGFSRSSYEYKLLSFDRFCIEHYPGSEIMTKEMVFKWIENEVAKKCSNIRDKEAAIRFFGRYLAATGKATYILPKKYITDAGKQVASPYIFTDEELASLFHAADSIKAEPFASEIAPVLFRLIYTCGLRPNEGRELKRANINFSTGEILITMTKRKKERIVVMSDDMLELCRSFDIRRRIFAKDSEYFFPARDGSAYGTGQIDRLFKKCWIFANPETDASVLPNVRIYDLRHRFASAVLNRWLNEGRNLYAMLPYLRAYMGHDKLSDTAYYIHLLPENLLKSAGINWAVFDELIPEVSV
jgi:integrase/recombinase XerD